MTMDGSDLPSIEEIIQAGRRADINDALELVGRQVPPIRARRPRPEDPLRIVYIMPRTAPGGGARVLFEHANALDSLGADVTVMSHFGRPDWIDLQCQFQRVPLGEPIAPSIPSCDLIVCGYWDEVLTARHLAMAPVVHFEQGDFHLYEEIPVSIAALVKASMQAADLTITVGAGAKAALKERFDIDAITIANAIDGSRFFPDEHSERKSMLVIGWDGTTFKGIDVCREVANRLHCEYPGLPVVWVTPQPPQGDCFGEVVVAPSQEELARHYREARVYVAASRYESFPLTPLEAMASGTPVVTTANAGVLNYARDGENALVVGVDDTDALVDAVRRVLDDEALAEQLRAGGLRTARALSWPQVCADLYARYRELCATFPYEPSCEDTFDLAGLSSRSSADQLRLQERIASCPTDTLVVPVSRKALDGRRLVRWETIATFANRPRGVTRALITLDGEDEVEDAICQDGLDLLRKGDPHNALRSFLSEFQQASSEDQVLLGRWVIVALLQTGQHAEAWRLGTTLVRSHPLGTDYYRLLGQARSADGHPPAPVLAEIIDLLGRAAREQEWFEDSPCSSSTDEEDLTMRPQRSVLEELHDAYFVQRVAVSSQFATMPRSHFFSQLLAGKTVLHVGYADWPITDVTQNLHVQLDAICAELDGVDPHDEAARLIAPHVRGKLFRDLADVHGRYDYVLVPEVIEHVGDLETFFASLDTIEFSTIIITAPDAYSCMARHFDLVREANNDTFVEVVHPDHNCWFTPYTLRNVVKKYTTWSVMEPLYFFNGISLMLIANKA
jgi:glycosyltransferase involved in cell wall biosynthesis